MNIYINKNDEKFLKYFLQMHKAELLQIKHKGRLNYVQFQNLLAVNSILFKLRDSKIYALF